LGLESLQKEGLRTSKVLLESEVETEKKVKDKRQRYSQEDLKILTLLSFLMLPYQGYKVAEGKKWMGLAEHIALSELKYAAKVAKFVQKTGELTAQLETLLSSNSQTPFKLRVVKWLRQA
jgi:hypothetical protein